MTEFMTLESTTPVLHIDNVSDTEGIFHIISPTPYPIAWTAAGRSELEWNQDFIELDVHRTLQCVQWSSSQVVVTHHLYESYFMIYIYIYIYIASMTKYGVHELVRLHVHKLILILILIKT